MEKNDFENFHFHFFEKFSKNFRKILTEKSIYLSKFSIFEKSKIYLRKKSVRIFQKILEDFSKKSKMKIFKIIFLHDEKIFFDNFWSFEKVYVSTFDSYVFYGMKLIISMILQTSLKNVSNQKEEIDAYQKMDL